MSQWLDEHRDLLGLVARDLVRVGVKATGRHGLPAEAVLRCAILAQYRQLSYQETGVPSRGLRLVPCLCAPSVVMEPAEVAAAKDDQRDPVRDLGTDNRTLLSSARQARLVEGAVVRLDSTVTAALTHEPSDSSLL